MHTYASIHVHVIFATWNRHCLIAESFRPAAHAYLGGAARNLGLSDIHVGGVADHLHFVARFDPARPVSTVIGQLKQSSSVWIRDHHEPRFRWQRGFGAFSVSLRRLPAVVRYIEHQDEHHRRRTFSEELTTLLREFGLANGQIGLL
jgi:REP element-mobilizing transposase RayT